MEGKLLTARDIITKNGLSFSGAISKGFLINSYHELKRDSIIPIAPIIQLVGYVYQPYYYVNPLKNSLEWIVKSPNDQMSWDSFEKFYCNWEVTFRTAIGGKKISLINDWFKNTKIGTNEDKIIEIEIPEKCLRGENVTTRYEVMSKDLCKHPFVFRTSNVYLASPNQRGFDCLSFFKRESGIPLIVFTDLKFKVAETSK